jgi:hypothetical protein
MCSVYRAPSMIMCNSALMLPHLAVTAVLFEMRYHFSTHALRAQYQYTCNNRCLTSVCIWTYRAHVLHTCIHSVCPYSETHCGSERRRITVTDVRENTPNSPSLEMRADYLRLKRLAAQGGCAPAILTSATIVPAIKFALVL